jgi:hypothetical protein
MISAVVGKPNAVLAVDQLALAGSKAMSKPPERRPHRRSHPSWTITDASGPPLVEGDDVTWWHAARPRPPIYGADGDYADSGGL